MFKSPNTVQTQDQNRALSTKRERERERETNYIESQIEDSENRNAPEFTNWNSQKRLELSKKITFRLEPFNIDNYTQC